MSRRIPSFKIFVLFYEDGNFKYKNNKSERFPYT